MITSICLNKNLNRQRYSIPPKMKKKHIPPLFLFGSKSTTTKKQNDAFILMTIPGCWPLPITNNKFPPPSTSTARTTKERRRFRWRWQERKKEGKDSNLLTLLLGDTISDKEMRNVHQSWIFYDRTWRCRHWLIMYKYNLFHGEILTVTYIPAVTRKIRTKCFSSQRRCHKTPAENGNFVRRMFFGRLIR